MTQENGKMVGNHEACLLGCGSNNMSVWEKVDSQGKTYHDGFCFSPSCTGYVSPKHFDADYKPVKVYKEFDLDEFKDELERIESLQSRGWAERRITRATSEFYGVKSTFNNAGVLQLRHYPVFNQEGKLSGYKNRNCIEKGFWATGQNGQKSQLFGQHLFPAKGKYLVITGGEEDAMAVFQVLRNGKYTTAVVSPTVGEGNAYKQIQNNWDFVSGYEKVVLMLDGDQAGKDATDKIAALFSHDKIAIWKPKFKDPCEYLQRGTEGDEMLKQAFWNAEKKCPAGIVSSDDPALWEAIVSRAKTEKIPLPPFAEDLQHMLRGGPALGEITLLAAACVDADTEYLTRSGFKRIADFSAGDEVCVYDKDGKVFWEIPLNYIKAPAGKMYHFKTKVGVDQVVSPNHKMPYLDWKGRLAHKTAEDIKQNHDRTVAGFKGKFVQVFNGQIDQQAGIGLSEGEVRLSVAVKADGRIVREGKDNYTQMRFRKKRKYERLLELCQKFNLRYSDRGWKESERTYQVIVWPQCADKRFASWWGATQQELEWITDEILHWDGTQIHTDAYFSMFKEDVDFIQYAFASVGRRGYLTTNTNGWTLYVAGSNNNMGISAGASGKREIKEYEGGDGYQYCFETTTGYWVARRNGNLFVTGNSSVGKTSVLNAFTYFWIFNAPYKVGIISLESDLGELAENLLSVHIGTKLSNLYDEQKLEVLQDKTVQEKWNQLKVTENGTARFTVLDHQSAIMDDELKKKIEYLVKVEGCKIIILDPLTLALSGQGNDGVDNFNAWYLRYVKHNNIAAFNVLHVRKNSNTSKANSRGAELSDEDLKGSSSLFQTAMNIWLFMRDKFSDNPLVRNTTKVVQSKARRTGNTGTAGFWYYNNDTGLFEKGVDTSKIDTDDELSEFKSMGAFNDTSPEDFVKEGY